MARLLSAGLVSGGPVRISSRAVDAALTAPHSASRSGRREHLAQELDHRRHRAPLAHGGHGVSYFHQPACAKIGQASVGLRCIGFTPTIASSLRHLFYAPE